MNLFISPRHFDPMFPELMDREGQDPVLLRDELHTLEVLNQRHGIHGLTLYYLQQMIAYAHTSPLRILDLGTGAADLPRAVAAWAQRRQLRVQITAVDNNPVVLQYASKWCAGWPEIRVEQCELPVIQYASESFDIVICGLVLHHLSTGDAVTVLRRIHEVARVGYIVNDLCRHWLATAVVELLAALVIHNPMTRYDARASSRAAFTRDELYEMARRAGMANFEITGLHCGFRMVLVGRR